MSNLGKLTPVPDYNGRNTEAVLRAMTTRMREMEGMLGGSVADTSRLQAQLNRVQAEAGDAMNAAKDAQADAARPRTTTIETPPTPTNVRITRTRRYLLIFWDDPRNYRDPLNSTARYDNHRRTRIRIISSDDSDSSDSGQGSASFSTFYATGTSAQIGLNELFASNTIRIEHENVAGVFSEPHEVQDEIDTRRSLIGPDGEIPAEIVSYGAGRFYVDISSLQPLVFPADHVIQTYWQATTTQSSFLLSTGIQDFPISSNVVHGRREGFTGEGVTDIRFWIVVVNSNQHPVRTLGWIRVDDLDRDLLLLSGREIIPESIGTTQISNGAITGGKILNNTITASELANNAITASKIVTGAITETKVGNDAITAPKIAANAVIADKIAANAVVAPKIASNAIISEKVAASAITADKIGANAVIAEKIGANAITSDKIVADAVTANKIASDSITGEKIVAGSIAADDGVFANGAIVHADIANASITDAQISGDIKSSNYDSSNGQEGWILRRTGNAQLNNAFVRGIVRTTDLLIDGICTFGSEIRGRFRSPNYMPNLLGFDMNLKTGIVQFNQTEASHVQGYSDESAFLPSTTRRNTNGDRWYGIYTFYFTYNTALRQNTIFDLDLDFNWFPGVSRTSSTDVFDLFLYTRDWGTTSPMSSPTFYPIPGIRELQDDDFGVLGDQVLSRTNIQLRDLGSQHIIYASHLTVDQNSSDRFFSVAIVMGERATQGQGARNTRFDRSISYVDVRNVNALLRITG